MKDDILDFWINIEGSQILLVQVADQQKVVQVEEREIITFRDTEEYKALIEELIASESYSDTHRIIKEFANGWNGTMWFSDDEIERIIQALFDNDQIS